MAQDTKKKSSTGALLAAFAVLLITILGLGWNVLLSAGLAAGAFFLITQLGPKPAEESPASGSAPVAKKTIEPAAVEPSEPAPSVADHVSAAAMAGQVKLGTLLPGERELANRKSDWRYKG